MQVTYGAWANIGRIVHSINDDEDAGLAVELEEGQKNLVKNPFDSNIQCPPINRITLK
jgi:hypothetical protein